MRALRDEALHRLASFVVKDNAAVGLLIDTRYRVVRRVARGGMGEVFLAEDTRLNRSVAMKILAAEMIGPELSARFEAEARTLSRIEDPGIVPIHDFGTLPDGRLYYTMKFVTGTTLEEQMRSGDLPSRLRILIRTCEIVHAAHERGVVHRDLKPANVMIDEKGQVFVLDWGIARVMDGSVERAGKPVDAAEALTQVGSILGTLHYMSPEQARGQLDAIDRRTDVYSLGAIFYEMLTGTTPVQGRGLETLVSSAKAGATVRPRDRNPSIPPELEAICLRALARTPRERYPTAAALAAELRAYLDGSPVASYSKSSRYRAGKWLRRHRIAAGLGGLALASVVVAILLSVTDRGSGRLREAREKQLAHMREATNSYLKAALELRRAGRLAAMEEFAEKTRRECEAVIQDRPDLAEPHYLIGRMDRAQLKWDAALARQDAALAIDPSYAPARLERGRLKVRKYNDAVSRLRDRWSRERSRSGRREEALPASRELEDADCRKWKESALADLEGHPSSLARALVAFLRNEATTDLFERAISEDPYVEEPYEHLGDQALAEHRFDEAVRHLSRGIEKDAGYLPFHCLRAEYVLWSSYARVLAGQDPSDDLRKAIRDLETAIDLAPRSPTLHLQLGRCHLELGILEIHADRNPAPCFEKAVAALEKAVVLNPGQQDALAWRGTVLIAWAVQEEERGGEPTRLYERAVADFGEAIRISDQTYESWIGRGLVRSNWADYRREHPKAAGPEPEELLKGALEDLKRAAALDGNRDEPYLWTGLALMAWMMLDLDQGRNPTAHAEAAIEAYTQAIQRGGGRAENFWRRGAARANLALFRHQNGGGDPGILFRLALEDSDQALRLRDRSDDAWKERGMTLGNRGIVEWQTNQDPEASFKSAVDAFSRAIEIRPKRAQYWLLRANVRAAWTEYSLRKGRPLWMLRDLEGDFEEAIRLAPTDPEPLWRRAYSRLVAGMVRDAITDFEKATKLGADDDFSRQIAECRRRIVEAEKSRRSGEVHYAAGRWAEALDELLNCCRQDAHHYESLEERILECYRRLGRKP